MSHDFHHYPFADGSIQSLLCSNGDVDIVLRNWKGEIKKLRFKEVIGLEAYGPTNEDLSHGTEAATDPLVERSCRIHNEATSEFKCYSLFSAWIDEPILKVVAKSFEA